MIGTITIRIYEIEGNRNRPNKQERDSFPVDIKPPSSLWLLRVEHWASVHFHTGPTLTAKRDQENVMRCALSSMALFGE